MKETIRIATKGIAEELRNMEIGNKVKFPIPEYNYNSLRTSVSTTLINERIAGWRWQTRMDLSNKCAIVTRIS